MIYLILLLSLELNSLDSKNIKKYSPEKRREITIELIQEKKYDMALTFALDKNLTGCIKILKGNLSQGIEDIRESAEKGNLFSCDLYILFNLQTGEKDLQNYIKKELKLVPDTTLSFESPFSRYLSSHPESLYIQNIPADSIINPYILFKSGIINIEKEPEKIEKYFKILLDNYPNSLPAIIARNTIRALKKTR
jgi:hypothetical protein